MMKTRAERAPKVNEAIAQQPCNGRAKILIYPKISREFALRGVTQRGGCGAPSARVRVGARSARAPQALRVSERARGWGPRFE
jgi:hypothetical protein